MDYRTPAKDIFLHAGNHPKLKQANKLIEQARVLEQEVKQEQDKHRKTLQAKYSYQISVKIQEKDSWSKIPEGTEIITIQCQLENKAIFEKHMHKYGSLYMPPDEHKNSVKFYRAYGMLLHDGGGHVLLKTEQPCSDAEWESIKASSVPDKFKTSSLS
jgi:hypothetical protein